MWKVRKESRPLQGNISRKSVGYLQVSVVLPESFPHIVSCIVLEFVAVRVGAEVEMWSRLPDGIFFIIGRILVDHHVLCPIEAR